MKAALIAAREALANALSNDKPYIGASKIAITLIDAALAQPEWTLPEPTVMASALIPNATGIYSRLYTEQQMRAAYEAGRMAG